jgi:hypothetical protein
MIDMPYGLGQEHKDWGIMIGLWLYKKKKKKKRDFQPPSTNFNLNAVKKEAIICVLIFLMVQISFYGLSFSSNFLNKI